MARGYKEDLRQDLTAHVRISPAAKVTSLRHSNGTSERRLALASGSWPRSTVRSISYRQTHRHIRRFTTKWDVSFSGLSHTPSFTSRKVAELPSLGVSMATKTRRCTVAGHGGAGVKTSGWNRPPSSAVQMLIR